MTERTADIDTRLPNHDHRPQTTGRFPTTWWIAGVGVTAIVAAFVIFIAGVSRGDSNPVTPDPTPGPAETAVVSTPSPTPPGGSPATPVAAATPAGEFPAGWLGYASERWTYTGTEGDYVLVAADSEGVVTSMAPWSTQEVGIASVAALDMDTGAELWRIEIPCYPLIPALTVDTAFVPCLDGTVLALARSDGAEIWRTNTGTAPYSPIVSEGLVITDSGSPDEVHFTLRHEPVHWGAGDVVALDQATGEERWRFDVAGEHSFINVQDGRVFIGTGARGQEGIETGLYVLDLQTGQLVWSETTIGEIRQRPRVVDGDVFVIARGTYSFDATTGSPNWVSERRPYDIMVVAGRVIGIQSYGGDAFFGLDAATGIETWTESFCDCGFTFSVDDGHAVISTVGSVFGVNPESGMPLWGPEGRVDADYGFTPAIIGDRIIAGSGRSGTVTALDLP